MQEPQLWTFVPNVGYVVGHLGESVVVYYCVDEWSEFSYVEGGKMLTEERELLQKVDLCFATASSLVASKKRYSENVFLAPHGVDYEHFARALDPSTEMPSDIAEIPKPRIAFFGQIHDWIDLRLIAEVAMARGDWSIILIGDVRVNLERIRGLPNVYCLGRRPYERLPGYCKAFQVGFVPFVTNELTRHVNPVKLREYLSAGLAVVSTELPEVRQYGDLVYLARTPPEFIARIEQAIREDTEAKRWARSVAMRRETWEARVAEVAERVMQCKASKKAPLSSNVAERTPLR